MTSGKRHGVACQSGSALPVCEFFNSPAAGWNKRSAVPAIRMVIDMSSAGTALCLFQPTENSQPLRAECPDRVDQQSHRPQKLAPLARHISEQRVACHERCDKTFRRSNSRQRQSDRSQAAWQKRSGSPVCGFLENEKTSAPLRAGKPLTSAKRA